MTFQQLEYIVAVDKYRHFVNAATACGVTQSTLSTTIQKLEQEIDVTIFDRTKHPIEPTVMGKRVIQQAEIILHNSSDLRQLAQSERDEEHGRLNIGMVGSVAQMLFPSFVRKLHVSAPHLEPHVVEENPINLIGMLQRSELDMLIISASDVSDTNLLSIELWTERFVLYVSPASFVSHIENPRPEDLRDGDIWTLRAFHDRYPQLTELTHQPSNLHQCHLEVGNLQTLIATIDANGGYTLIPETYALALSPEQRRNIRKINSGKFFRTISLAIRQDYMRERMLNVVTDAIKAIIPQELLSNRLKNFDKVKL